jgi:hypothetical protein
VSVDGAPVLIQNCSRNYSNGSPFCGSLVLHGPEMKSNVRDYIFDKEMTTMH